MSTAFIGDSITSRLGALNQFYGSEADDWTNAGVGGDTIQEMYERVDTAVPDGTQRCVILGGINDIVGGATQAEMQRRMEVLVAKLRVRNIRPIICTVMPLGSGYTGYTTYNAEVVTFNSWLTTFTSTEGIVLVDLYTEFDGGGGVGDSALYESDDIHPNASGKTVQTDAIGLGLDSTSYTAFDWRSEAMAVLDTAVAYWKAVDYSGSGNLIDGTGNGHDAIPGGSPSYNAAGGYFTMTAANEDEFRVPHHADLEFGASDSFTLIFMGTTSQTTGDYAMIAKRTNASTQGYMVQFDNLRIRGEIDDGTTETADPSNILATGDWQDETSVWSFTRDVANDNIWVDGPGETAGKTTDATTGALANGLDLYLCSLNSNFWWWDGNFYGAAIFNSVLSDSDKVLVGAELLTASSSGVKTPSGVAGNYGINIAVRVGI